MAVRRPLMAFGRAPAPDSSRDRGLLACIIAAPFPARRCVSIRRDGGLEQPKPQPQPDLGVAIYQLLVQQQTQAVITEQPDCYAEQHGDREPQNTDRYPDREAA
jgi:hypothetical protein